MYVYERDYSSSGCGCGVTMYSGAVTRSAEPIPTGHLQSRDQSLKSKEEVDKTSVNNILFKR